jgi:ubiquinone/menaquinone biosynthesis C-methylase UbiE
MTTQPGAGAQGREGVRFGGFSDVDATGEADRLAAVLEHLESLPQAASLRERSYELLRSSAGARVVDVGCGLGKAVAELTARGIEAVGVDSSEQMITRARRRFPNSDFRVAPAESLPFNDRTVHGYRAERLYGHLQDPGPALAEARRVLQAGGRFVLLDVENDPWAIDSDEPALTRVLLHAFADAVANPWIGRRSRGLLLDAGFGDVTVEVQTVIVTRYADCGPALLGAANAGVGAGVVSREQAEAWLAELRGRDERGRFFVAVPCFLASARRP